MLVTGGRKYSDRNHVFQVLGCIHTEFGPISCIVEGGATGADALAKEWALHHKISFLEFPADWKSHGRRAGGLRNSQMLAEAFPDLVVAFLGGAGTADMTGKASRAGVTVVWA